MLLFFSCFPIAVNILACAREDSAATKEKDTASKTQNTKDDIARIIHLYKEPAAQVHWCNLYGILSRQELDAHKSTGQ
jgi:hypothetical protein